MTRVAPIASQYSAVQATQEQEPGEQELGVVPWAPGEGAPSSAATLSPSAPSASGVRLGGRVDGFLREARALAALARDRPALTFLAGAVGVIVAVRAPMVAAAGAAVLTAVSVGQAAKSEAIAAMTDDPEVAAAARADSGGFMFQALLSYAGRGAARSW